MPYLFAAYRKGALASMGGAFSETGMEAAGFREAFTDEVMENYHAAWTLFAPVVGRGTIPVGAVLGFWSHPNPAKAPFMIVGDMLWFPWSSPRNRVEAAVQFFGEVRKGIPMVEYARADARKFFEVICRHGVMNRVGTTMLVYPGEGATIFETRRSTS